MSGKMNCAWLVAILFIILQLRPISAGAAELVFEAKDYGNQTFTGETILKAVESIGNKKATLVLKKGKWFVQSDVKIPANISLRLNPGALILIDKAGFFVDGFLEAGLFQIFSYKQGMVDFGRMPGRKVYPHWWGACGDGKSNDWVACQQAVDSVGKNGGTVEFGRGTYKIDSNSIVLWGSYTDLVGDDATIVMSGSAGQLGTAIAITGKRNGATCYGILNGGNYMKSGKYTGSTDKSHLCSIRGFTIKFLPELAGTLDNGIGGSNLSKCFIKDCRVIGAPQTSYAFIAAEYDADISLENCASDGARGHAYRFITFGQGSSNLKARAKSCTAINTINTLNASKELIGLNVDFYIRGYNTRTIDVELENCKGSSGLLVMNANYKTRIRNSEFGWIKVQGFSAAIPQPALVEFKNVKVTSTLTEQGKTTSIHVSKIRNGKVSFYDVDSTDAVMVDSVDWVDMDSAMYRKVKSYRTFFPNNRINIIRR